MLSKCIKATKNNFPEFDPEELMFMLADKIKQMKLDTNYVPKSISTINKLPSYYNNSCYIDSFIAFVFYNKCDFWREILLVSDLQDQQNFYKKDILSICQNLNFEQIKQLAKEIRERLVLVKQDPSMQNVINLRTILGNCNKELVNETFIFDQFYQIFCELFPFLKIKFHLNTIRPETNRLVLVENSETNYFSFNTFINKDYEYIKYVDFDTLDNKILVFSNEIPDFSIPNLSSVGNNNRSFDFYILENRYELVGAIMLQGVSRGGVHFTLYFKNENDDWEYYDDMSNGVSKIVTSSAQERIFLQKNDTCPIMYFYARVNKATEKRKIPEYEILQGIFNKKYYIYITDNTNENIFIEKINFLELKYTEKIKRNVLYWEFETEKQQDYILDILYKL